MLYSPACSLHLKARQQRRAKDRKKKKAYWQNDPSFAPVMTFDEKNCEWTVWLYKSEYTKKGDCQYTNGCTIVTTATLLIDARTKKIRAITPEVKKYHNYE